MLHIAVDQSKKVSYVVAMDDDNKIYWDGKLANTPEAFQSLKAALPKGPAQSVVEAGWNWGIVYDLLEGLELGPILANPLKMRTIAESFVKTDKIDAWTHLKILKAGLTPQVYVPCKRARRQKNVLRQRMWLVKLQTMVKNRIHVILDRHHLSRPERSDLFGAHGRAWLKALELPAPDDRLLRDHLELLDQVRSQVRETQRLLGKSLESNPNFSILRSLPGAGDILAGLIALEIHTIERFFNEGKFCSCSGLVSSTYSSGDRTVHGRLVPACNHHLRFAFIEAAWTAVKVSPYFQAYFKRLKFRIGAQQAIGAVARKLCQIAYHCLKQRRPYVEKPYRFKQAWAA